MIVSVILQAPTLAHETEEEDLPKISIGVCGEFVGWALYCRVCGFGAYLEFEMVIIS